jgi:tRNA dimethylallyltransferase
MKNKLVIIVGPTASGKTGLSIKLAKKYKGEIISADSRQVYKGMNIGTGKVTKKEMQGIPHYLLDVASPKTIFSVTKYKKLAEKAIKDIQKRNKIPFLVGGTGFYIQAAVDGILIPEVKPDWKLRKKLEKNSTEKLFKQLKTLDPIRAKNIDKYNRRRLIRALEIILKTKRPIPAFKTNPIDSEVLFLGITKSKKELYKLISVRLTKRLKHGMVAETKRLREQGISWKRLEEFGLEYRYLSWYLQGKLTKDEMIEKLQKEIEHYAKRQMTWFKKDKRICWIKNLTQAERLTQEFL